MKNVFILLLSVFILGCEKEAEVRVSDFDYDLKELYGIWDVTHWGTGEGTFYPQDDSSFATLSLSKENIYTLNGYYGDVSGKYKAKDKELILYQDDKLYARVNILFLDNGYSEVEMIITSYLAPVYIRLKRR